ncbi:ABC transporter ATP-binding protein [Actibacterium sp.]|uniref:ABC transporter ATP-binding protein n=1 Tax=Actibacterium sp. TaxID=1872125 RepID=UPI00356AD201
MSLLDLQDLQKSYGALAVTQNFSMTVEEGDLVGILGPNGAGKTTLFNQITGTVKPDHGEVWFDGEQVTHMDASQRCQLGIARSFQVPHPFVGMTVYENILVGATFGRSRFDPRKLALDIMDKTGMGPKANQLAGSLTLLDRKRLEMARALAADPKLLLLDEIAGGLTDSECVSLLQTIRDVHDTGVTIIWIEHVVHALMSVAKRLVVVDFGRKVTDGDPETVMKSSEVRSIYMGEDAA